MSSLENTPFKGLKPENFWKHFYALTQIPRPSKHEEKAGDYLVEFAEKQGLEYERDQVGNVLIRKKASAGKENLPGVILQSHFDMVTEKNRGLDFDFMTQPLNVKTKTVKIDGKDELVVYAEGTSLGADNGVGVAASLAVLEDGSLEHPPLECLFTMDEETGMTGAKNLSADFLKGKRLLNLDSEDENDLYIGCAGGVDNRLVFHTETVKPVMTKAVKLMLKGLRGGHSGLNIHEGRGNAVKLLGRFLWNLEPSGIPFELAWFSGGNKRNAIAREAEALIVTDKPEEVKKFAEKWTAIYADEFEGIENLEGSGLKLTIAAEDAEVPGQVLSSVSARRLLDSIFIIPHGVIRMSAAIAGLVETSTNLAIVRPENGDYIYDMSHRSSSATVKEAVSQRTEAISEMLGFDYSKGDGYPGWQPNMHSPLLLAAGETYKKLFNREAHVKAIHAGLECGLILEKYPGMDAISFGPTLKDVHSPDEMLVVRSVDVFWPFLVELLKVL